MELKDLRVLVTGATAGIGRETAKLFARRGATVVVTGRNAERGEQTVAAIVAVRTFSTRSRTAWASRGSPRGSRSTCSRDRHFYRGL